MLGIAVCLVFGQSGTLLASSGGYQISDVLGQTDNANNPVLTTNALNNNARNPIDGTAMFYPDGVALDSVHHRLFVADCNNNRVLVYNLDGSNNLLDYVADNVLGQGAMDGASWTINAADSISCPNGLVYDSVHNRLFVADWGGQRVVIYDFTNGLHDGMDASHELGQTSLTAEDSCDVVNAQDTCYVWNQMAYDPVHDRLFVGEYVYSRVAVFDLAGGITDGMDASHVLGQTSLTAADGDQLTRSGMSRAYALAYDSVHQRLFVADNSNNRVLVYDLANGLTDGMDASNVLGQTGYGVSTARVDQASTATPYALAYDSTNDRLFVFDDQNNRILAFDTRSVTNNEDAVALLGQPGYDQATIGGCEVDTHSLCDVELGMAYDPTNNRLIVADSSNNRVVFYDFVHIKTPAGGLPSAPAGANYSQPLGIEHSQGAVTFAVTRGTLPPGLSLNTSTGVISGTPTVLGAYTFEVAATDVTSAFGTFLHDPQYTITVTAAPPDTGFVSSNWLASCMFMTISGIAMLILAVRRSSRRS